MLENANACVWRGPCGPVPGDLGFSGCVMPPMRQGLPRLPGTLPGLRCAGRVTPAGHGSGPTRQSGGPTAVCDFGARSVVSTIRRPRAYRVYLEYETQLYATVLMLDRFTFTQLRDL